MKYLSLAMLSITFLFLLMGCSNKNTKIAEQWSEIELVFHSQNNYENPYSDIDFHAIFISDDNDTLIRPGFWDGENTWKIRFASPLDTGTWKWISVCSDANDEGLHGKKGFIECIPYSGSNSLLAHGLLLMSPGKRNVIHADGTPFLVIGDTPWALPWRGTTETVKVYAKDRMEKGCYFFSLAPHILQNRASESCPPEEHEGQVSGACFFRSFALVNSTVTIPVGTAIIA